MDKMNQTDDLFKYVLSPVEKVNSTAFLVTCESDLFVELSDEWHVSFPSIAFASFKIQI